MESKALVITRVRDQARDTRSFDLKPAGVTGFHDIAFSPGQVAVLKVGAEAPCYFAFASAPEDKEMACKAFEVVIDGC